MNHADANSAAAHLLRHLHDAKALQTNPLVAHIFSENVGEQASPSSALNRVHDLVIATAEKLFGDGAASVGRDSVHKQRQLEIVLRCDIRGELHKAVQLDLGIGKRQFYRERRQAKKALAGALEALVPANLSEASLTLDRHGLCMSAIKAARLRGDDGGARALILKELATVTTAAYRFDLLAVLAEIFIDGGVFEDARNAIGDSLKLGFTDAHSRGRILQITAYLAATQGRFREAARFCREALTALKELPMPKSIEDEERVASTLLLSCLANHNAGFYQEALTSLQSARAIIEQRPDFSVLLRVQLLMHLGASQMFLPASRPLVESHLLQAKALAQRNGLIREVVSCTFYISQLHGDSERALDVGREALAMVKQFNGAAIYAWFCIHLARREQEHGYWYNAIRLAQSARAGNQSDTCMAVAKTIEAEAELRLDHCERARILALNAVDVLRSAGNERVLGEALCIASQAAYRLGQISEACREIDESVTLLQQFGHHTLLSKAVFAAKAINGDTES